MSSGQISSGLDLPYAPSTITTQRPTEGKLDLLFEAMYDDYVSGQPSAAPRTVSVAQAPQVLQTPMTSTTTADTAPTPTNSSSPGTSIPSTSQNVNEPGTQQQHGQPHPATIADNESNPMFDDNTFVNPFVTPSKSFIDADHPSHVYKLKKALYGLKQAPRVWYGELSMFLLHNHFFKGTIDPPLFIRRFDDDILVVQVYVDDIIFGSIHPRYTQLFSDLMKSRFEMSMMGEMTFFLGLQVNQSPCGIFINQSNYVLEILKKYRMESCDPVGTLMEIKDKLDLDQHGSPVDATKYRSMIGALMYLTSSRPDIVHATCLCARYQAKPTEKHLKEVKMIFRYLRGSVNMGLWYTKDSGFELTGFSNADYEGCKDTFKSTSGEAQFLGEKLVSWSSKKQDCTVLSTAEAEYVSLSACCAQVIWMRT
ncbi:retrovirus-related pol polyprotein from transposon TNT 1-94 [Tanacetum coccineum]